MYSWFYCWMKTLQAVVREFRKVFQACNIDIDRLVSYKFLEGRFC